MDFSSKCMGKALQERGEHEWSCWFLQEPAGTSLSSLLDLAQQLQQQLFGGPVLPTVPRVKVDHRPLKVGHHFGERPQLNQEQEVEVLQAPRALSFGLACVKAPSELQEVRTPD